MKENPLHFRRSPSTMMTIKDDGTIRTYRGEARYKFPFLACQLSMFFALARYRVVKIVCSFSMVVLQTMKNYKAHYSLFWFRPLLRGNSPTYNIFCDEEEEQCYNGLS
jgi:hypothetical protein